MSTKSRPCFARCTAPSKEIQKKITRVRVRRDDAIGSVSRLLFTRVETVVCHHTSVGNLPRVAFSGPI